MSQSPLTPRQQQAVGARSLQALRANDSSPKHFPKIPRPKPKSHSASWSSPPKQLDVGSSMERHSRAEQQQSSTQDWSRIADKHVLSEASPNNMTRHNPTPLAEHPSSKHAPQNIPSGGKVRPWHLRQKCKVQVFSTPVAFETFDDCTHRPRQSAQRQHPSLGQNHPTHRY